MDKSPDKKLVSSAEYKDYEEIIIIIYYNNRAQGTNRYTSR